MDWHKTAVILCLRLSVNVATVILVFLASRSQQAIEMANESTLILVETHLLVFV